MATYLFDNSKNLVDVDSSGDKYGFDKVKNRLLFDNQEGVYGIDKYKNMIEVEVDLPVIVPMALSDGSVVFYDRGSTYGDYIISKGNIIRLSEGTDDGSTTSNYWRYLICDQYDLDDKTLSWAKFNNLEGLVNTNEVGYGLSNTNTMITRYPDSYWWRLLYEKRNNTGFNWFMPSSDEIKIMYNNRMDIINCGGNTFNLDVSYWASSEENEAYAYCLWFDADDINNALFSNIKLANYRCRAIRRI